MAKCAGETVYADDLNLPRMIYGKLLRSPHPHARILGISTARALKLDGVFAVITGEEMPEKFGIMPSTQDEEALVIDKARYAGDPVVAVVQLGERELFRPGHEGHDRFVGQVSQVAGHAVIRP